MATAKKTDEVVKTVSEENIWDKKVEIMLPKPRYKGEPNYVIASVNGRQFKIQKGVRVEVPAPIAEVIQHSYEAEEDAERFIDGLLEKK